MMPLSPERRIFILSELNKIASNVATVFAAFFSIEKELNKRDETLFYRLKKDIIVVNHNTFSFEKVPNMRRYQFKVIKTSKQQSAKLKCCAKSYCIRTHTQSFRKRQTLIYVRWAHGFEFQTKWLELARN